MKKYRNLLIACGVLLFTACEERPLISGEIGEDLNFPSSMAIIPGTPYGIIVNANVNLNRESGSMTAVDLDAREILFDTQIAIPSFAGLITVDVARSRIYIPDRGQMALLVYEYAIPGTDGEPISFEEVEVPSPVEETANGILTDENPTAANIVNGSPDLVLVTNATDGTVTFVNQSTLKPMDLNDSGEILNGLALLSAANFHIEGQHPGRGANRIVPSLDGQLRFITSTLTNNIYVLDPAERSVEAMMDLSSVAPSGGTRGMVIDPSNHAYVAHRGINGVLVLDVSGISENGIDQEVVDSVYVDSIPTGRNPDGVAISSDGLRIFVANQGDNTVSMIEAASHRILNTTTVGRSPGDLVADSARGVVYVPNFLSNTITVLDDSTGAIVETIR